MTSKASFLKTCFEKLTKTLSMQHTFAKFYPNIQCITLFGQKKEVPEKPGSHPEGPV